MSLLARRLLLIRLKDLYPYTCTFVSVGVLRLCARVSKNQSVAASILRCTLQMLTAIRFRASCRKWIATPCKFAFLAIWKQRAGDHTRAPLIKVKREREGKRGKEGREEKGEWQRRLLCYMSSVIFPRSLRNSALSSIRQRLPLQFSVQSDKYCALWLVIIQMARLLLNADSFARITTRD